MRLVRQDERGGREAIRELDREVTSFAAKHLIDEACERWCAVPEMVEYLTRRSSPTWLRTPRTSRSPMMRLP